MKKEKIILNYQSKEFLAISNYAFKNNNSEQAFFYDNTFVDIYNKIKIMKLILQ